MLPPAEPDSIGSHLSQRPVDLGHGEHEGHAHEDHEETQRESRYDLVRPDMFMKTAPTMIAKAMVEQAHVQLFIDATDDDDDDEGQDGHPGRQ